jgi:hypothetical protein
MAIFIAGDCTWCCFRHFQNSIKNVSFGSVYSNIVYQFQFHQSQRLASVLLKNQTGFHTAKIIIDIGTISEKFTSNLKPRQQSSYFDDAQL